MHASKYTLQRSLLVQGVVELALEFRVFIVQTVLTLLEVVRRIVLVGHIVVEFVHDGVAELVEQLGKLTDMQSGNVAKRGLITQVL